MSTSRDADFPNGISQDELSANLIKCAMLVKKGEKDPLIRQTIHDLTFYLTGKRVSGSQASSGASAAPTPQTNSPRALSRHPSHTALTGVFSKLGIGPSNSNDDTMSVRSDASKMATSAKNAERAKAELRGLGFSQTANQEWCEVHSTMGCHCKLKKMPHASGAAAAASATPAGKPHFQRPSNPSSALIANGWIEQQRRSKMRIVWKEVLASLVEGRKPGEETTLWIQREVRSQTTGKPELEALHQIPVKWIQAVSFFSDRRFILKVYNLQEEFVFRCERSEEAAQNWVLTLRSIQDQERVKSGKKPVTTGLDDWDKIPSKQSSFEDEKKVPEQSHRVAHATPQAAQAIAQHTAMAAAAQQMQSSRGVNVPPSDPVPAASSQPPAGQQPATAQRMSIKELRAIAHGAGVMTHGMERADLERVVQQISALSSGGASNPQPTPPPSAPASGNSPPPPSRNGSTTPSDEEIRRKHAEEHQRLMEESARLQKIAEEAARAKAVAEAQKKEEDEKRKLVEEQKRLLQEADKKKKAEEERQNLEAERKRREEEEHQRRLAEMQAAEQRRRQEEQQRQQQAQWQQQQQNWQKHQAENEQRRLAEEARVAEERRRQEEVFRAHQQWQSQQPQAGGVPPQAWQQQHPHPMQPPHPHAPYGQPPQQPFAPGQAHRPDPRHTPPPTGNSPVNMKYAQMAAQTGNAGQMSLQAIKHGILIEWALQPPNMQTLRPIEVLITSIHAVFPPKFGVPGHEHFKKWTVVTLPEVLSGTQPDDEKLNKVVRKLRFVLHPDKLPRDFSDDQMYMCKMLWDIISDAFEDHKKREEELGWMR